MEGKKTILFTSQFGIYKNSNHQRIVFKRKACQNSKDNVIFWGRKKT